MAASITALAVDCAEPAALARWWHSVLGGDVAVDGDGEASLRLESFSIDFLRVPDPKTTKNRLHLDINPTDRDQDAELERLIALGAERVDVGQPENARWYVLRDPDGNEFCLLRTRVGD